MQSAEYPSEANKPPNRVVLFLATKEGENFLPSSKRFVGAAKKPRRLFGLWSREHEGCAVTARSRRRNRERTVSLRGKYATQQKQNICLPTNVLFLNDVCLRQMMLASPNDVWLRHILGQTSHHCDQRKQHHFERSEKHHIAARRCIIYDIQGFALICLRLCDII